MIDLAGLWDYHSAMVKSSVRGAADMEKSTNDCGSSRGGFSVIAIFMVAAAMITCNGTERQELDRRESVVADSIFAAHLLRLSGLVESSEGADTARIYLFDTLNESVSFLVRVTGLVDSGGDGDYFGWFYPTRDALAIDIAKWENWYHRNGWRLHWDSLSQDVVVDSIAQEP